MFSCVFLEANRCCQSANSGVQGGSGPVVRFYYDYESGTCEQFIYKGAGGNDNRFEALELCLEECDDVVCS